MAPPFPMVSCKVRTIRLGGAAAGSLVWGANASPIEYLCPAWTGAKKSGRPKKGERYTSGLEKAMAKGKPRVKRVSATKRRWCLVCGKFGHDSMGCWFLEKGEDIEPAAVHTLPIAEEMEMDDEGHDDEGKEASV